MTLKRKTLTEAKADVLDLKYDLDNLARIIYELRKDNIDSEEKESLKMDLSYGITYIEETLVEIRDQVEGVV